MAIFLIILVVIIVIYLLLNKRDNTSVYTSPQTANFTKTIVEESKPTIEDENILIDEDGRKYKEVVKEILTPRKTYIYGSFTGKYNGELLTKTEHLSLSKKFYSFNIYECIASVNQNGIRKDYEGEFPFIEDENFNTAQLPKSLNCHIEIDNSNNGYNVTLRDVKLNNISLNRKLHQTDGNEIFGTITGNITGYILDFLTSYEIQREYIDKEHKIEEEKKRINELTKTSLVTGKTETKGNQNRLEYYYSDYKTTYWGDWKYQANSKSYYSAKDFLATIFSILGGLLALLFLFALLPNLLYVLPVLLLVGFFYFLKPILRWFFTILSFCLLLLFLYSIFNVIKKPYYPPVVSNNDTLNRIKIDTSNIDTIKHFASWVDYDNNNFTGTFWTLKKDYASANNYKSNLNINTNNESGYAEMLSSLSTNDASKLNGIYLMFDSIKQNKKLDSIKFAQSIVSFVQTIPYAVVLPQACDATLYNDEFIQKYLSSEDAKCDGFEKFGINTPVEFLSTLKGDCDTRTLLLYTLLSHYNYDVAIFSSSYYSHSLMGINLPFTGAVKNIENKNYVLWETTAQGISPGVIPTQISNLNYWYLSIKSK